MLSKRVIKLLSGVTVGPMCACVCVWFCVALDGGGSKDFFVSLTHTHLFCHGVWGKFMSCVPDTL